MGTFVRMVSQLHRVIALVVIAVLVGFFGRGALADEGPPTQAPDAAPQAIVYERGSFVDQVAKSSGTTAVIFTSTSFVNLSGAYQYIIVPAGARALIDARFTAESV